MATAAVPLRYRWGEVSSRTPRQKRQALHQPSSNDICRHTRARHDVCVVHRIPVQFEAPGASGFDNGLCGKSETIVRNGGPRRELAKSTIRKFESRSGA